MKQFVIDIEKRVSSIQSFSIAASNEREAVALAITAASHSTAWPQDVTPSYSPIWSGTQEELDAA